MNTLLALCLVLHPMRIDESVHSGLKEKFGDKMQRMQKGSEQLSAAALVHLFNTDVDGVVSN